MEFILIILAIFSVGIAIGYRIGCSPKRRELLYENGRNTGWNQGWNDRRIAKEKEAHDRDAARDHSMDSW